MNQNFATESEPTLVECVGRGAVAGAAASLVLLPAVSYLAHRLAQQREAPAMRLANVVAARLGRTTPTTGPDTTLFERPVPFLQHVLVGAAWGALYGAATGATRAPAVPGATAFGVLATLADRFAPVPLRLFPSASENPDLPTPFRVGVHLLWGSVLGLAFNVARMVVPTNSEPGFEAMTPPLGQTATTPAMGPSSFVPPPVVEAEVLEVVDRFGPSSVSAQSAPAPADVGGAPAVPPVESANPPPTSWQASGTRGEETVVLEPPSRDTSGTESASRETVGAGAQPMAGTMPGAMSEQVVSESYGRRDLVGKMVFTRDRHPIGDVRRIELNYVEVATPVVQFGPILYVPYTAFQYCSSRGCFLAQTLDQLAGTGWNQIPEPIVEAENLSGASPRESEGPPPPPGEVEIPFLSDEEAARRFGTS